MPWVRLEDSFADHPKIERAGPLAAWLHVAALCYCARHLTDGRLPRQKASRLADIASPETHIDTLLRVGLWSEDGDDYVIHDYLDYQPSRADVESDRAAARDRMAKNRRKKQQQQQSERSEEVPPNDERSNGRSSSPPSRPVPSRPDDGFSSLQSSNGLGTELPPVDNPTTTEEPAAVTNDNAQASDVPPDTWEHYAQLKYDRQPDGKITNPGPWKTTTAENARTELGEQAADWWHKFDVSPAQLAAWLIDGQVSPHARLRPQEPA